MDRDRMALALGERSDDTSKACRDLLGDPGTQYSGVIGNMDRATLLLKYSMANERPEVIPTTRGLAAAVVGLAGAPHETLRGALVSHPSEGSSYLVILAPATDQVVAVIGTGFNPAARD